MEPDTKKLHQKIRALKRKCEDLEKETEKPYKYSRKYNPVVDNDFCWDEIGVKDD